MITVIHSFSEIDLFLLVVGPLPKSTLFPYTTLFRSQSARICSASPSQAWHQGLGQDRATVSCGNSLAIAAKRSEEHTSELQSRGHLVCRLLLEKKKSNINTR